MSPTYPGPSPTWNRHPHPLTRKKRKQRYTYLLITPNDNPQAHTLHDISGLLLDLRSSLRPLQEHILGLHSGIRPTCQQQSQRRAAGRSRRDTPELLAIAPMGRGKVQLRRIENPATLQVTFSKRKSGLIKKAREIAVLCDTEVAVIIFSPKGKLYEYSTDSKMRKILDRYEQYSYAEKEVLGSNAQQGDNRGNCTELSKMKHRIECLQKRERQLLGEDLESLNLIELQNIEQKLEDGLRKIRARQNSMLLDSIAELQEKGKLMQERNNALEKKMTQLEENRALTQAAQTEQQNATGKTCSIQDLHINDHVATLDARMLPAADKNIVAEPEAFTTNRLPMWMLCHINK